MKFWSILGMHRSRISAGKHVLEKRLLNRFLSATFIFSLYCCKFGHDIGPVNCLERLISEMAYSVSNGMLRLKLLVQNVFSNCI